MFSDPYIANRLTIDRNCDTDHHLLRHPEPACAPALKIWTMTMAGSLTDKTAARPRSPPRVSPLTRNLRDQAAGLVTPRGPPRQNLSIETGEP
jgi:hypothetical protein